MSKDIKPGLLASMALGGSSAVFAVNFTHPIEVRFFYRIFCWVRRCALARFSAVRYAKGILFPLAAVDIYYCSS